MHRRGHGNSNMPVDSDFLARVRCMVRKDVWGIFGTKVGRVLWGLWRN